VNQKDDLVWRTQNSLWLAWAFVPGCAFIAFLWIGLRAKAKKWIFSAILYLVPGFCLISSFVRGTSWGVRIFIIVMSVLFYFAGIIHALVSRSEYLRRYKARLDAQESDAEQEKLRREFMGADKGKSKKDKDAAPATPQSQALEEGFRMTSELYQLYQSFPDERMKDEMAQLYTTAEKIYRYVASNADSAPKIRKFNEYYFPEVLKMLREYEGLLRIGENEALAVKLEGLLQTMVVAFNNQLDGLMSDKTMDMRSDIDVLEQMAKRDGLSQDGLIDKL